MAVRRKKSRAPCLIEELPSHLMMEILSRVPIKALSNCRFVCKFWLQLISDPFFIKLHLSRSPTGILFLPTSPKPYPGEFQYFHTEEKIRGKGYRLEKMKPYAELRLPYSSLYLVNSCNGLICLADSKVKFHDFVHVMNPILGEYITIPVADAGTRRCKFFGFGYSAKSNQYKVIQTFYPQKAKFRADGNYRLAEIYTIGTGRWRSIGTAVTSIGPLHSNTFFRGSIHWACYSRRGFESLCSFDFDSEKFRPLPFPPNCEMKDEGRIVVGVLKGCLCVSLFDCYNPEKFDMWVMKEYGVKESWTKQFVIENLYLNKEGRSFYEPVIFLNNEIMFMFYKHEFLVCYNTKRRAFENAPICRFRHTVSPVALTPCLASLHDIAKEEQVKVSRLSDNQAFHGILNLQLHQAWLPFY